MIELLRGKKRVVRGRGDGKPLAGLKGIKGPGSTCFLERRRLSPDIDIGWITGNTEHVLRVLMPPALRGNVCVPFLEDSVAIYFKC